MGRARQSNHDLPKRVYRSRGKLYYVGKDNRWIPIDSDPHRAADQALHLGVLQDSPDGKGFKALRICYGGSRRRAGPRQIEFLLTWDDMLEMWRRSGGRCEVSGIPFAFHKDPRYKNRPFAPSIDRIDNSASYTMANCRLVCIAVNLAINEWGIETLRMIADGMRRADRKRARLLDFPDSLRQAPRNMVPRGGIEPPT